MDFLSRMLHQIQTNEVVNQEKLSKPDFVERCLSEQSWE